MTCAADSELPAVEKQILKRPLQYDPWLTVVLACFTLLAWVSWGKLANPIWDTGHEVEIPVRLLAGQLLYRDVEIFYGPLAYYSNALALLLFGHHLEVFYAVGLVLALGATLLVYRLTKRLTDARWAVLCTVYVLIYCAFSPGGLTNFIVPYSYGAVYATVLCLLAFTALDCYGHSGRAGWLVAAAIACGFAGLAKQEYGVAALGGVLVGANICYPKNLRTGVGRSILIIMVASTCVLLPLALLAQEASWQKIYSSLLPISHSRILVESGLFDLSPAKTLKEWTDDFKNFAASSLVIWGSILAVRWIAKSKWLPGNRKLKSLVRFLLSVTCACVGLALLRMTWGTYAVFHPLGNMSWLLPLLVGWFSLNWEKIIRHRHSPLLWALLVFSVLLNARFLFCINFYGLYAVTAVLLFFTLLYRLAVRTGAPVIQYVLICLLIGGSMNLNAFGKYRYPISSTQGTLYINDADLALAFNQTIHAINTSGATSILVIPEGSILNFLTSTHAPSRETNFIPGILPTAEAEQKFLTHMQKTPPELIVYVDVPFYFLKKNYQTYAKFNPLVDGWITHQNRLVYSSNKLIDAERKWVIRIYTHK